MARKAIAYVSDIIIGRTGEVISRQTQKEAIQKHAMEQDLQIVAWFEDEEYNEDVLTRPGIRQLLACPEKVDCVLVERVWSLSRNWTVLARFFSELERKGMKVDSAACLWDCTSQMARHHFAATPEALKPPKPVLPLDETARYRVRRPERLHFLKLAKRPSLS